ncbi:hypothetical protein G7Z12_26820 [Streptomyces sp. ID38640]|uniref:DUF6879 family protein n=1 Tax=Streptomyces sp. ID38640 TaxID=1265399 RepID=UPI00140F007C|nr:DUF6879 family protein [Streptomyces sp. ID38640]QIK09101.1 hypothetical protein G7Z12_26820 [Streptomyces sp. ID38640]
MFDSFPNGVSERLDRPKYHEEFYRAFESGIEYFRKIERGQHFQEPGFASHDAFAAGDWGRALTLVEEKREAYGRQFRKAADLGVEQRRLRVVEFPVTPYVQWEMHVLRLRVELGESIRVLDARRIEDIERANPVPEVVILGESVMYGVCYDADGNAAGANRFSDPALIAETISGFDALYERAESFHTFFDREIKPLPAPRVGG